MIYCLGDLQTAEFRRLGAKDKKKRKGRFFGFNTAGQGARTGAAIGGVGVGGYKALNIAKALARPEGQQSLRNIVENLGGGTRGKAAAAGIIGTAIGVEALKGVAAGAAGGAAGGYLRSRLANQNNRRRR